MTGYALLVVLARNDGDDDGEWPSC